MWSVWFIDFYYINQDRYSSIMSYEEGYTRLRIINLVINILRTIAFILSSIFQILEKDMIEHELKNSPLDLIDENLNEEIYKSVISVCKNPENQEERARFSRLSRQKTYLKKEETEIYSSDSKLVSSNRYYIK